ncbi:MAG: hypothetical protein AB7G75_25030 [Candidatus Binatia bacterium]
MTNQILTELTVLLQDTVALLDCSEPDTETWEQYNLRRQRIFTNLQALFATEEKAEAAPVQELLQSVIEKDRLLMQKLVVHRTRCCQDLAAVAKARQALKDFPPSSSHHFLERAV